MNNHPTLAEMFASYNKAKNGVGLNLVTVANIRKLSASPERLEKAFAELDIRGEKLLTMLAAYVDFPVIDGIPLPDRLQASKQVQTELAVADYYLKFM